MMDTCPHCGGHLMHLKNKQVVELTVMRVYRLYICRKCRRTTTKDEIYMLKRGIPLTYDMLKGKGKQ